jgi:GNAT superfamily N-acetyltransferase
MPTVSVVRTYLEMTEPGALRPSPPPDALAARVEHRAAPGVAEYRALYRSVGERYHWRDRLAWSDAQLAAYLADADVALWVLTVGVETAGYFELRGVPRAGAPVGGGASRDVEIVYFGLTAPFIGRGLGKYLLTRAVEEAWRTPGAARVWLNTCTLDDPAALPNYLARGFAVARRETYSAEV